MYCKYADLEKEDLIRLVKYYRFDALTGFMMRKDFDADFSEKYYENKDFYLVLFDVNGLHNINKELGYAEGDALIRRVAQHIERCCSGDIYRIGGDEIAVITEKEPATNCINSHEATSAYIHYTEGFNTSTEMFAACDKKLKVAKDDFYKDKDRTRL